ncbi:ATP-dependent DNA helicase II subunit 1 [Blastocladiella emersonii ATCC 22665]|nr:ATP-dependent DNA helicase II subunit 1 [Blastocladiella emersonii ATCC 22665]
MEDLNEWSPETVAGGAVGPDDGDWAGPVSSRDALLVVIDCNATMFEPLVPKPRRGASGDVGGEDSPTDDSATVDGEEEEEEEDEAAALDPNSPKAAAARLRKIPFFMVVQALLRVLQDLAVESPGDRVSVYLYNTGKSNTDVPHLFEFQKLDEPGPAFILNMYELGQNNIDLASTLGLVDPKTEATANITNVLVQCLRAFRDNKAVMGVKRVLWVTNQDTPIPATDLDARHAVRTRIADLRASNIRLSPYFVSQSSRPFDVHAFWTEALGSNDDDEEQNSALGSSSAAATSQSASSQMDPVLATESNYSIAQGYVHLVHSMQRREAKPRIAFRVPLFLTDTVTLGVQGVLQYKKATKPPAVPVVAETNERLGRVSQLLCTATTQVLQPTQVRRVWEVAKHPVALSADEHRALTNFGPPHIAVLGFKSRDRLKRTHNVTHATLLLPDETQYTGSVCAFAALVEQLHAQNKVAIARYYPRRGGVPRLAALLPQWEQWDKYGMVHPTGLQVIPLPFKDELRAMQWPARSEFPEGTVIADPETAELITDPDAIWAHQVDAAAAAFTPILRKWRVSAFNPRDFDTPSLVHFHHLLHAKALDCELHERPLDAVGETGLEPDYDTWQTRCGRLVPDVKEKLNAVEPLGSRPTPRVPGAAKASKVVAPEGGIDEPFMRSVQKSGTMAKCTVAQLKEFCRAAGLPVSGAKGVLVERIEAYLAERPE